MALGDFPVVDKMTVETILRSEQGFNTKQLDEFSSSCLKIRSRRDWGSRREILGRLTNRGSCKPRTSPARMTCARPGLVASTNVRVAAPSREGSIQEAASSSH